MGPSLAQWARRHAAVTVEFPPGVRLTYQPINDISRACKPQTPSILSELQTSKSQVTSAGLEGLISARHAIGEGRRRRCSEHSLTLAHSPPSCRNRHILQQLRPSRGAGFVEAFFSETATGWMVLLSASLLPSLRSGDPGGPGPFGCCLDRFAGACTGSGSTRSTRSTCSTCPGPAEPSPCSRF